MSGGLYIIWLSDTHYYGGRAKCFKSRWASHLRELRKGCHNNQRAQRVFSQHGRFDPSVLSEISLAEDRAAAEQRWLDENAGQPGCVNISPAAEGGPPRTGPHTPETKLKISQARSGVPLTLSHREALSKAHLGSKHSEEQKRRISENGKGKHLGPHSAERKLKNSESHRGKQHSEETKRKMRESHARRLSKTES